MTKVVRLSEAKRGKPMVKLGADARRKESAAQAFGRAQNQVDIA